MIGPSVTYPFPHSHCEIQGTYIFVSTMNIQHFYKYYPSSRDFPFQLILCILTHLSLNYIAFI